MTDAETAGPAEAYNALVTLLNGRAADYTLIDHEPAGATGAVSALRGHPLEQAAKCLLIMVKVDQRTHRYVLASCPGTGPPTFPRSRRSTAAGTPGSATRPPLNASPGHTQVPCSVCHGPAA